MCRVLIYLGQQHVSIHDLLYGPDNSLTHQSYAPKLMAHIQNLAGLGFCAWSDYALEPNYPFYYRTTALPFFDKNLYRLSKKITTNCMLAHVRGVDYSIDETVSEQNVHPFLFEHSTIAFAHNGSLAAMATMKSLFVPHIKPEILAQISGTTDSEWIYALFLSQLPDYQQEVTLDVAWQALITTLTTIRSLRAKADISHASPVNLFLTNGKFLIVTRFVYDFGCYTEMTGQAHLQYHSLWVTSGETYGQFDGAYRMVGTQKRSNILFASEPLTCDRTNWVELPECSITKAWIENDQVQFFTQALII